ncbi:MAG TPA: sulfite reductase flavoprotein subunit alpha [Dokdonella sp.]|uniref:sulfite reductase subunit alpha n=1 Tax=Dokdonella sp. TaxID=2291710 RepID=UPI002C518C26|nr:sulfite reductase flavoprotein subunit alpha [Dokdonella sp.]HUD40463.1 sulfite reductase flavoprotein subunit alpha [Dokdonella sp.]
MLVTAAILAALAALAGWLLALQGDAVFWRDPPPRRLVAAAAIVLTWLALTMAVLLRERRRRRRAAAGACVPSSSASSTAAPLLVAYASQTGFAEQLAAQTLQSLAAAGSAARLLPLSELDAAQLAGAERILFVVSTTGEGDPPDGAIAFVSTVMDHQPALQHLRYGLLALGDSEYVNYCGFGRQLEAWLRRCGATPLFDAVEVDNGDEGALRHWQHHLALLTGHADLPDWSPPQYGRWRLAERILMNPGSAGDPCFHLALVPTEPGASWQAGDIAEIGPRNAAAEVARVLAERGLDAQTPVRTGDGVATLAAVLAASRLPASDEAVGAAPQALVDGLQPLPHREYSIASLPADGAVHLLIRQMRRPDGTLGIGTGWLTEHAPIGATIALRTRSNSNFHAPPDARPLILIGNGTGLAGLRALLKERIAAGRFRNWLVFGERHAAHDWYYRDEIEAWRAAGRIERLDLAFSRDQPERIYVQQRLREAAGAVRDWIEQGASVYVCGSLDGMAPGVEAALLDTLGRERFDRLAVEGRYRRDVY